MHLCQGKPLDASNNVQLVRAGTLYCKLYFALHQEITRRPLFTLMLLDLHGLSFQDQTQ